MNPEEIVRGVLAAIGEDPTREGLLATPGRVVRSWSKLFGGYGMDPEKILATTFAKDGYDQMVVLRDIPFFSTCEHHLLPFHGRATVGYIPGGRVVGLSKLARLVECFSRRLQVQERMTQQIAEAIQKHLEPIGVGVLVRGVHLCMVARGVEKPGAKMVTSAVLGAVRDSDAARDEFMRMAAE